MERSLKYFFSSKQHVPDVLLIRLCKKLSKASWPFFFIAAKTIQIDIHNIISYTEVDSLPSRPISIEKWVTRFNRVTYLPVLQVLRQSDSRSIDFDQPRIFVAKICIMHTTSFNGLTRTERNQGDFDLYLNYGGII